MADVVTDCLPDSTLGTVQNRKRGQRDALLPRSAQYSEDSYNIQLMLYQQCALLIQDVPTNWHGSCCIANQ